MNKTELYSLNSKFFHVVMYFVKGSRSQITKITTFTIETDGSLDFIFYFKKNEALPKLVACRRILNQEKNLRAF